MFFKKLKNVSLIFLLTLVIMPKVVFAYSDYIIAGGENIGISLNSRGILVVGSYEVNGILPAAQANLKNGDKITHINNVAVSSINEMINVIESASNHDEIAIKYERGSKKLSTTLKLEKDTNNIYKTGLYVKDSVSGIGTLTFIDPNTMLYGALGHEIIEKATGQKVEIKDGKIYNSSVTGVTKSNNGNPGEKNARYNPDIIYGNVLENTSSGVFGKYTSNLPNRKLYKVAKYQDIKQDEAKILTVLKDEAVEEFKIKILKISDESKSIKNILFEVIDENLLSITGGILQGMSGSPIIQGDYIIGAVTHVVVDNPKQGYGIFITNMLEEAEN